MRKVFILFLMVMVVAYLMPTLVIAHDNGGKGKGHGYDDGPGKGPGKGKGYGHNNGKDNDPPYDPDDPNGPDGPAGSGENWVEGVRCETDWERATYPECKGLPYIPAQ